MPIRIQSDLPAKAELEDENIFVMDENRALSQDFRELRTVSYTHLTLPTKRIV